MHVAHRLRAAFPDGQLHADLRRADGEPVDPAEPLEWFLRSLGVDPATVPDSVEARAAAFRSQLGGQRFLVVLDNAAEAAQVLPLLPGTPGCAVLVTSRRPLSDLPGARLVAVDVLTPRDSAQLLRRLMTHDQAAAAADIRRLAQLCGGLPLALRVAGARLAAKPHWSVADLVDRLADERQRLDELVHGRLDVRGSLAYSYRELAEPERALLGRLSLLDAADLTAELAAQVCGDEPVAAERVLERLVDAQLLDARGRDEHGQHVYRFHDLIRLYAREMAAQPPRS